MLCLSVLVSSTPIGGVLECSHRLCPTTSVGVMLVCSKVSISPAGVVLECSKVFTVTAGGVLDCSQVSHYTSWWCACVL